MNIYKKNYEYLKKRMLDFIPILIELKFKDQNGKQSLNDTYYSIKIEEKTICFNHLDGFKCFWNKDGIHYQVTSGYISEPKKLKEEYLRFKKYIKRISYK